MGIGSYDGDDVVVKGDDGTKTGKKVSAFDDCQGEPALNIGSTPGAGVEVRDVGGETLQYAGLLLKNGGTIQLPAVEDKFITEFIVNALVQNGKEIELEIGTNTVAWVMQPGDFISLAPKNVKSITITNNENQDASYQVIINYRDCI